MATFKIVEAPNEERYATVRCPSCASVGWIDREQYEGKVPMVCMAEVAPGTPCRCSGTRDFEAAD